ncbi:MAG: hypothetical protein IPO86_09965 [Saprospiraceae bacterium]|nr:hypothetical protein [Saprospiraceae bacterium]
MNPIIARSVGITLPTFNNASRVDNGRAILKTADGRPINEFITNIGRAVFKNGRIDNVRNMIIFKNAGTTDIMICGNIKLKPDGSLQLGSSNNVDLNFQIYSYDFPSDPFNANGFNRLEIIEVVLADKFTSSYQAQGIYVN